MSSFFHLNFSADEKIIDTHCHLDSKSFYGNLDEILIHSFENGIDKIIIPGADIKDLPRAREIAHRYENVFFAAGVHPYEIDEFNAEILHEFLKDEKCIAAGEIGLDYFRLKQNDEEIKLKQKQIFKAQIQLAIETKKPVIIHSRDANEDTYKILKNHAKDLLGGVLHCFNASELLLNLHNDGFYFGIGGVLTFKNAKNLAQILPKIPKNKLLIETDAPYLTPEPFRGRVNEPILTHFVAQKMSEILGLSKSEILELCYKNSNDLFNFKTCSKNAKI